MNILLAVLFWGMTSYMFYIGNSLQVLMSKETYTTPMGVSYFYVLLIAPIVTSISAYSIFKSKYIQQALVVNILQLIFVAVLALYAYSTPVSMMKKEMRIGVIVFFLFYVIPSLVNLNAFRKMQIK